MLPGPTSSAALSGTSSARFSPRHTLSLPIALASAGPEPAPDRYRRCARAAARWHCAASSPGWCRARRAGRSWCRRQTPWPRRWSALRRTRARASKPWNPQSSILRASSARSFSDFAPVTTTIRRKPSCTADPTRLKPASAVSPVLSPSAPMPMASSGLRFCCRMLFQVNSRSAKYG